MSDRGSSGDEWDQPTEYFPPTRRDEPSASDDLPPIGADRDPEPTRVIPPSTAAAEPTTAMPETGGPFGPGGPYVPPTGGPGGPGGPGDEPPYGEPEQPWYRQPGPIAALIAGVVALVLALVALLVLRSDDDDDDGGDTTLPTVSSTTIVPPLTEPVTTTSTTTTVAETTTTSSTTTSTSTTSTSTTTTSTTTTTLPPTTTTTPPTTTTTAPAQPSAWSVLQTRPELSQFAGAILANGLVDLVDGPQPVTVLAPENQNPAFTLDEAGVRRQLIGEALTADQIFDRSDLQTLNEPPDTLTVDDDQIDGVTILEDDITAGPSFIQIMESPFG